MAGGPQHKTHHWGGWLAAGLLVWSSLWGCCALAFFQDNVSGARPAGMGGAFTAVADDAHSVLYNPAGLSGLGECQLTAMYANLFSGLNAQLYNGQTDQLGYHFIAAGIPMSPEAGALGAYWTHFTSTLYQENTFALSYARELWTSRLSAGINLKALQWQVAGNEFSQDPAVYPYAERQKDGFTADLGLLATLAPGLRLGLSLDNVIPVSMGMEHKTPLPQTARLGAAFGVSPDGAMLDAVQWSLEGTWRNGSAALKAGTEAWLLQRRMALRLGAQTDELTAGAGLRYGRPEPAWALELDYAFSYPLGIEGTNGSHRLGLTLAWNSFSTEPTPETKIKPETAHLPVRTASGPVVAPALALQGDWEGFTGQVGWIPKLPEKIKPGSLWRWTVRDARGVLQKASSGKGPLKLAWNGRDRQGRRVSARAAYPVAFTLTRGSMLQTVSGSLVLPDTTPKLHFRKTDAAYADKVYFSFSEPIEARRWELKITDETGRTVRTYGARDDRVMALIWDSKDEAGKAVPNGRLYAYTFMAEDQAGHQLRISDRIRPVAAELSVVQGHPTLRLGGLRFDLRRPWLTPERYDQVVKIACLLKDEWGSQAELRSKPAAPGAADLGPQDAGAGLELLRAFLVAEQGVPGNQVSLADPAEAVSDAAANETIQTLSVDTVIRLEH